MSPRSARKLQTGLSPSKRRKTKNNRKTHGSTRNARLQTNCTRRNYRNNRTPESRERYRRARNEYLRLRKEAERQFENDIASKAKIQPKLLHNHNRRETAVKEQVMKLRKGENRYTENDKEVYEELNKRFQEIVTIEQGEAPALNKEEANQATLEEFDLTSDGVKRCLLELDVTKAVGLTEFHHGY